MEGKEFLKEILYHPLKIRSLDFAKKMDPDYYLIHWTWDHLQNLEEHLLLENLSNLT